MHALSISAVPLESRWSVAGKPACYVKDRTHRLVSRKAATAARRVPPRSTSGRVVAKVGRGASGVCDLKGGCSSACSKYFCGSSPRRRLLRIVRANGTFMLVQIRSNLYMRFHMATVFVF